MSVYSLRLMLHNRCDVATELGQRCDRTASATRSARREHDVPTIEECKRSRREKPRPRTRIRCVLSLYDAKWYCDSASGPHSSAIVLRRAYCVHACKSLQGYLYHQRRETRLVAEFEVVSGADRDDTPPPADFVFWPRSRELRPERPT